MHLRPIFKIQILNVGNNELEEFPLAEMRALVGLQVLDLSSNSQLSGILDDSFFIGSPNIKVSTTYLFWFYGGLGLTPFFFSLITTVGIEFGGHRFTPPHGDKAQS